MKQAVTDLGLMKFVEKGIFSIFLSRRIHSCSSLGILGSRSTVHFLTLKLYDLHPQVISSAIIALGETREAEVVPSLLDFFKDCSLPHAWFVAAILPFFGSGIYKPTKPYLNDVPLSLDKRLLLIKVVANLKLTESLRELQDLAAQGNNLDIRINALLAIGRINDLLAVKTVLEALEDPEWQVRAVAANLIGEMAIKGAAFRLVRLLEDKNWFVRKNAAAALAILGKIGIIALFDTLKSDDRYARDISIQTLEENGIIELLIDQLLSADRNKRNEAHRLLNSACCLQSQYYSQPIMKKKQLLRVFAHCSLYATRSTNF